MATHHASVEFPQRPVEDLPDQPKIENGFFSFSFQAASLPVQHVFISQIDIFGCQKFKRIAAT